MLPTAFGFPEEMSHCSGLGLEIQCIFLLVAPTMISKLFFKQSIIQYYEIWIKDDYYKFNFIVYPSFGKGPGRKGGWNKIYFANLLQTSLSVRTTVVNQTLLG